MQVCGSQNIRITWRAFKINSTLSSHSHYYLGFPVDPHVHLGLRTTGPGAVILGATQRLDACKLPVNQRLISELDSFSKRILLNIDPPEGKIF